MMEEDSLETLANEKGIVFSLFFLAEEINHAPHMQFTTWKVLHTIFGLA